ncbi:MAG: COX15/CtaA family protein [Actinomycetota bacterium]|nr:COX15/CtaA family protein [Actinomycetota bacterium]
MHRIRQLALASTITTFLLVGIGGLVRATRSGLGCGDNWPHCPGELTRAMIIEFSHRAVAGILVLLLGTLAVAAWRRREEAPSLLRPCLAAFGLVLFQALLGAIVVWLHLEAESVVLHLATAMALFALLILITARTHALSGRPPAREDGGISRSATGAAAAVLVLLLVGSYVTGREAGYVFGDWPLMNGSWIPDLHIELYAIHFFHRALAAAVGLIVFVVGIRIMRRRDLRLQSMLAHVAVGAYALEVLVGAANVWTRLNAGFVALHLALGALIWGSLVGIAIVSRPLGVKVAEPRRRRSQPALETTGS